MERPRAANVTQREARGSEVTGPRRRAPGASQWSRAMQPSQSIGLPFRPRFAFAGM